MRFKTCTFQDPELKTYLNGALPNGDVAVQINSLNDSMTKSQVTFEIFEKGVDRVQRPHFIFCFLESLRIRYWVFILLPLLSYLSFLSLDGIQWRADVALLVLFGALFGFSSLAQLSDILDYKNGWDRTKPQDYTVLSKGWLTATDIKKSVVFGLVISFIIGTFLIWMLPFQFLALFGMAVGLVYIWIRPPFEFKYRIGGELIIYLLLGPILIVGFAIATVGKVYLEDVFLGSIFGLSAMFLYQLKRFQYLMSESRSQIYTTLVRLGFDRSKHYLLFIFIVLCLLTVGYQFFFHGFEWGFVYLIVSIICSYCLLQKLGQTVSPLGRNVYQLQSVGKSLTNLLYSLWILQSTWYIVISGLFYAN